MSGLSKKSLRFYLSFLVLMLCAFLLRFSPIPPHPVKEMPKEQKMLALENLCLVEKISFRKKIGTFFDAKNPLINS